MRTKFVTLFFCAISITGCDRHYARVQAETCEIMTHLDAQQAFLNQTWNARWEYQREIFKVAYKFQSNNQEVPQNVLDAMQPCD